MSTLNRVPTKAEAALAAILSLIATLAFGAVAYFLWFVSKEPSAISTAFFSALALASAVILARSIFTSRRKLTSNESKGAAWLMILAGAFGTVTFLIFSSGTDRIVLLAPSVSCLAYGLAALKRSDA